MRSPSGTSPAGTIGLPSAALYVRASASSRWPGTRSQAMEARSSSETPTSRVDGHAKVTGAAKYAGEFNTDGLVYAAVE